MNNNTIKEVQSIVNDLPLEDILNGAETLANVLPIPYLPQIIKVLRILVALRPTANTAMNTAIKIQDKKSGLTQKRETFNNLFEIAMSDGEITPEEMEFLRPRAVAAGFSEDEFELMIMNKNINQ